MNKKFLLIPLSLLMVVVMAACATSQATPQLIIDTNTNTTPVPGSANGTPAPGDNGGPGSAGALEGRLAYGTLKLEGTSNAVTSQEAKTLLPLWQKVKDLSGNGTPTPQDIQTVYQEIEKAMTPDQITAIQQMSMNAQDFQSLMQTLGITVTPGPGGGGFFGNGQGGNGTLTPEQQATRSARQTQFAGTGGNGNGFSGTRTPGAGGFGRGGGFGGFRFNNMFIDPLIKILTTRAGS